MNRFHTDPTGMPGDAMNRLSRVIEHHHLTPTARVQTPYGDIYVAERRNPFNEMNDIISGGWDVIWASRGIMRQIEMKWDSTQENRVAAALQDAFNFISKIDKRH